MRRSVVLAGATSVALACVVMTGSAHAESTVETKGVAAIVNDDIGMARDRALDDAKRKAVEQVAGARVSAETITQNFQLVTDRIYSRASGFVKNFEIKSEYKEEGTYYVTIAATVDADAIAENLDQLFAVKPRVIVMIAEQNVGAGNYAYWWGVKGFTSEMDIMQSTLIAAWQPKGFEFVDPAMLQDELRVTGAMKKAEMANDNYVKLSRKADAEVAIVGKVSVTDAGPVMEGVKMRSFHAVGTLRVLNVDTGQIIAVADDSAVAAHIDGNQGGRLAIKALAQKIGDQLQAAIVSKWTAEAAGAKDIELVIRGRVGSKQISALKKFLVTEVRGVERVDVRRRKKSKSQLRVKFRGKSQALGASIENKAFTGFGLELESVTTNKVVFEVKAGS